MNVALNLFRYAKNVETYSTGQHIFDEGQPGDVMYVVQEGEIDIVLHGNVIETVGPGGVIGEMALIDNGPRSATAIAKTDVTIVPINQKRFDFLVQETPFFATQVMRVLVNRLRLMDTLA